MGTIWNPHFLPALLVVEDREMAEDGWSGQMNGSLLQRGTDAFVSCILWLGEEMLVLSSSVKDSASDSTFRIDLWQKQK